MVDVSPNLAFRHYSTLPAANGSQLNVLGFAVFSLTLSTITNDVEALVAPSFGLDSIPLDNSVTFGAVLDWENQILSFPSAGKSTPAVHRTSHPASRPAHLSTFTSCMKRVFTRGNVALPAPPIRRRRPAQRHRNPRLP